MKAGDRVREKKPKPGIQPKQGTVVEVYDLWVVIKPDGERARARNPDKWEVIDDRRD